MTKEKIEEIYRAAENKMKNENIGCFEGMEKPLFMISEVYPGLWLEHLYDSIMFARLYPGENEYMKNALELFMDNQKEDGQFPCFVKNPAKVQGGKDLVGFSQIQECVSFGRLSLEAYEILGDKDFLSRCFMATKKWVCWLRKNRMTLGLGLVEMFYGFDTGHDNSDRLLGMSCPGNRIIDGVRQNAASLPPDDGITPIIAVDMNCNLFGNLTALSEMARILGKPSECEKFKKEARDVKKRLFEVCFDKEDAFFYDTDRSLRKRKLKSSTIFHLFLEGVLDRKEDASLIGEIYRRHIKNEDEFWTPCPLPSVAYCDAAGKPHKSKNCWGYFCQLLIYLRCTLWMDKYGFSSDFDYICEKVLLGLTDNFEVTRLGQELDPITAIPSESSEWYSSCMLFYVYAARRLKLSQRQPK